MRYLQRCCSGSSLEEGRAGGKGEGKCRERGRGNRLQAVGGETGEDEGEEQVRKRKAEILCGMRSNHSKFSSAALQALHPLSTPSCNLTINLASSNALSRHLLEGHNQQRGSADFSGFVHQVASTPHIPGWYYQPPHAATHPVQLFAARHPASSPDGASSPHGRRMAIQGLIPTPTCVHQTPPLHPHLCSIPQEPHRSQRC